MTTKTYYFRFAGYDGSVEVAAESSLDERTVREAVESALQTGQDSAEGIYILSRSSDWKYSACTDETACTDDEEEYYQAQHHQAQHHQAQAQNHRFTTDASVDSITICSVASSCSGSTD